MTTQKPKVLDDAAKAFQQAKEYRREHTREATAKQLKKLGYRDVTIQFVMSAIN